MRRLGITLVGITFAAGLITIKGNSHMMMMDKNSDQIADLIQKWLAGKGLTE